ncbi:MAG TPA: alpha-galactosidase [Actinomycetota bacterium]|nr:alpha-galactosidase [Actinomycetota bacterium]
MTVVEVTQGTSPVFALHTQRTSYVFTVAESGLLRHLHWGGRIGGSEVMPELLWELSTNDLMPDITVQEYPPHGRFRYNEQALRVKFDDGGRELDLAYTGHETADDQLTVRLTDPKGLTVDLHYRVLPDIDAILRWATITSSVPGVVVESVASAQLHIPFRDLTLRNVQGRWGAEQQEMVQIVSSKVVLESRRGISNHHHSPYAVLSREATETHGRVWAAALAFSGNTKVVVEQTQYGQTLLQLGVNDFDLELPLEPGVPFVTPQVVAVYCEEGLEGVSHRLHAYGESLMDPRPRPVLYNSWEATNFAVTAEGQIALAHKAAEIGAELFVVDDGWFGRRSPGADGGIHDGLGDWWVDPQKFPDGLTPLIDAVKGLGMDFGIWVEPEMVNPGSDLFAAHPDWIYAEPGRSPDEARGQYVLNLTLPPVRQFVLDTLNGLLRDNEIAYIKWDANRPMSQVGAQRDVWVRHIEALYEIVREVKSRHPGVLIEACASGGGRIDFGALGVFDDFWTSDNTDAADRLEIQRGYSLVYPPRAMRAWVTDVPNFLSQRSIPLPFRFHSAMMGSLGIGCDLTEMSEADLKKSAKLVAEYKKLRPLMRTFHRLENPSDNDYRLFQYSADEGAVLFAFLPAGRVGHTATTVRLRGLDPEARYRFTYDWQPREASGAYLMNRGLRVWLLGDYASTVIRFDRVTADRG